jgi:CRP-like cAMP-binding protein
MEFLTKTAEERYLRFLVEYEEFAAMIPQKDVASYIGVTPVALSRIKSRLRHRALDEQ